jgi:hypothetical protein
MKKEDMVSILATAGVEPRLIEAMTQAYEMGFEQGARAYVHLTEVVECAKQICEDIDASEDMYKTAWRPTNTKPFWYALNRLKGVE